LYVMLPKPEVGSHPTAARNPELQQIGEIPTAEQQLFSPDVTSLNLFVLLGLYNVGLMYPTLPNPFLFRFALISEIIPAKTGADAEVPYR
jgi:hypothetical protein